jgi:membrane associated rhomboid family serine protease
MSSGKDAYRIASYGLIHADWMHLAINMYVLYNFGENGTELMYTLAFGAKGILFFILLICWWTHYFSDTFLRKT